MTKEILKSLNIVDGVSLTDENLTEEEIVRAQNALVAALQEEYPTLDFSRASSLHDIVIRPSALLSVLSKNFVEEFTKTRTLNYAIGSRGDKNDPAVDAVLSNFFIERRPGSLSTGILKIDIEDVSSRYMVDTNHEFHTSDGLKYFPSRKYSVGYSSGSSDDVKIHSHGGSSKSGYFLIEIVSETVGQEYNKSSGIPFFYEGNSMPGLISCTSASNISGGESSETNQSLRNRVLSSLSFRGMSTRMSISQSIKDQFPETIYSSVHGINSFFLSRAAKNPFKIKTGAFCDVYIKNCLSPVVKNINLVASRLQTGDKFHEYAVDSTSYIVKISSDVFPGHYDVFSVLPGGEEGVVGSYTILKKIRGFKSSSTNKNFVTNEIEAAFSCYSETYVVFSVPDDTMPDDISVVCAISGQDGLSGVQDMVNDGGRQSTMIDTLVKSCVPCFISIESVKIRTDRESNVSESDVVSVLSEHIASINPSVDSIRVDNIVSIISSMPGVKSVELPITVKANILTPSKNFDTISVDTRSVLSIPSIREQMIGKDTIGFFTWGEMISVKIIKE